MAAVIAAGVTDQGAAMHTENGHAEREHSDRKHHELELMLMGYGLTTAQILYRLPDHPSLLQTYIWQDYDLAPKFPVLFKFLDFWRAKLEGPLHSIAYTHRKLIAPNEWRNVSGELVLH